MNRDQNEAETDAPIPASTAGLTTKVVKGSMWTLAGQVAPLIFTFASTYFVVRIIAAEGMGVLAALVLIPNYFTFADLGMSLASTKFASEAYAEGDTEREGRIIRTAALIAMLTAMPIAAAFILFSVPILVYFNVPENYLAEASTALKIGSGTFLLNFLCSIVNTPQLSRLRMDLNTFINALTRITGIVATPVVLHFGFGIVGVATALFIANLACLIGHLVVSGRLLGGKLFQFSIDRTMLRPLLNYGFAYIAAATAGVFLINGEKGILTNSTSTTTLAFYTASFTLASMLTMFSGSVVQSLLPAFAQLQTEERKDHLGSLYSTGVRLNLIWIVPTIAFLFVVAKPFFTIYYHRDSRFGIESPGPFYILLAGVAFNIVAYLPYSSIMAAGRVNALAKLFWIEVVPYLVMTVFLTHSFGIIGAAMSWTIRAVIDSVIQFIMASRIANVRFDVRDFGVRSFGAMLIFVPTAVLCVVRPEELLWIVPLFFISLAVYSVFAWRVLLSGLEREWLANRARMMFPAKTQIGFLMTLTSHLLATHFRSGMRGSTWLTNFLSARMNSLQSVPINVEHGVVYGDLRLPIYHSVLAGSRVVDESEDLVMRKFIDKGDVAYDIGALAGIYTLALAEYVGDSGKVFVFEPNGTLLPTLRRTCEELSNARLFPVALSDREGSTSLFVPVDDASMTSLSDWTDGAGGEVTEIMCEMQRLDDLVENEKIPLPDFVKCDVEGAEIAVFRGAQNTFDRADAPVILFEINPQATLAFGAAVNEPAEFLLGLLEAKYRLYEIKDGGLAEFDDAANLVIENGFFTNVVAVPDARRELLSRLASK